MPIETVTVSVGGQAFASWTKIAVHASVKDACRSLTLLFPDTPGAPRFAGLFIGGPQVTVTGGGETIFTGLIDKVAPRIDSSAYHVEVCGRSKGQDAVDSSVDHTKPDYVKRNVLQVAQDQDRFGIGFSADVSFDGFDRWRPNPGETLFQALRPLAEDEGCTMAGQPDGSVKITRAGETAAPQGGFLVEGQSGPGGIWKGEARFDLSGQHSKLTAHGQAYKGSGAENLQITGEASNSQVQRFRPFIEHHDRQTDKGRLKKRASRRRDKEAGEGTRATVTVRGWRDQTGQLWTPGKTVMVISPSLFLSQMLLIEQVIYDQGGAEHEATIATLHLVDPRAHGGSAGGIDNSGPAWGFDDSAAS